MKNENKKRGMFIGLVSIIILLIVVLGVFALIEKIGSKSVSAADFINNPVDMGKLAVVSVTRPQDTSEPTIREWVLGYAESEGLNPIDIHLIIDCESKWDNWAVGWNTNGTVDYGIFQINSVHKKTISVEDRFDYKKATIWAVAKMKRDNSYDAWVCAKKLGLTY